MLDLLRLLARKAGWHEQTSAKGTPVFDVPGGSRLTFEPGGQLELSAAPQFSVSLLLRDLENIFHLVEDHCATHGVELLTTGIDPRNPVSDVPLQFTGERYRRMTEYFDGIGPAGVRMMRQTATLHLNLDFGPDPVRRWRLVNAMAPVLVDVFANSPWYRKRYTGFRSYRSETWRTLDWTRTGLVDRGGDPVREYLEFALDGRTILLDTGESDGDHQPFSWWWNRGTVGLREWHDHLSTLFPEVRPRGYLELRSVDSLPLRWLAAPLALVVGLCYDPATEMQAAELLGQARTALLHVAGADGLADPRLTRLAHQLIDLGLEGCRRLGPSTISPSDMAAATDFFEHYTRRGRCPASDRIPPEEVPLLAESGG